MARICSWKTRVIRFLCKPDRASTFAIHQSRCSPLWSQIPLRPQILPPGHLPPAIQVGKILAVNRIFEAYPTGAIGEGSRVRCKSGD